MLWDNETYPIKFLDCVEYLSRLGKSCEVAYHHEVLDVCSLTCENGTRTDSLYNGTDDSEGYVLLLCVVTSLSEE